MKMQKIKVIQILDRIRQERTDEQEIEALTQAIRVIRSRQLEERRERPYDAFGGDEGRS